MAPSPVLLLALAGVLTAGLLELADRPLEPIHLADASDHEGGKVLLEGTVERAVPTWGDRTRLLLVQDGHGLWVDLPGPPQASIGDRIQATGDLWRRGVDLELRSARAADVVVLRESPVAEPGWPAAAADPDAWAGVATRWTGLVDDGLLVDKAGHRLRLGSGDWPASGPVSAQGLLRYEPACFCYQLHATRVTSAP
ncbi:MAG: hypothetical protein ACPGQL_07660 [Thermoplasmatota archaeon]